MTRCDMVSGQIFDSIDHAKHQAAKILQKQNMQPVVPGIFLCYRCRTDSALGLGFRDFKV